MIGTETVWEETRYTGAPFGYDTGRASRRQAERFVVHPNTIKTLPRGQAVVIAKDPEASVRIVRVAPSPRSAARGPELG
jgi:type IV secretory pathway TraG/TraD family ATPase VirD4